MIGALADELGSIEAELAPFAFKIARLDQLRKAIRGHFDAMPGDRSFEGFGQRFLVAIGQKAAVRTIDRTKLIKAIGPKAYAAFARTTLADLEANVGCAVVAEVVTAAYTGARSIKTFERGAA